MPLYRTTFSRTNFSFNPTLTQSADVLLKTDIPFDDEHVEQFEAALWAACFEQNPHWKNAEGPLGATTGWSSVMGGRDVVEIPMDQNLMVAWHIPAQAWLKPDGVESTVDLDEAGRFTMEEALVLQQRYPGERHS